LSPAKGVNSDRAMIEADGGFTTTWSWWLTATLSVGGHGTPLQSGHRTIS
jgi:hypothetical protein